LGASAPVGACELSTDALGFLIFKYQYAPPPINARPTMMGTTIAATLGAAADAGELPHVAVMTVVVP
jgi:hypothetical protein